MKFEYKRLFSMAPPSVAELVDEAENGWQLLCVVLDQGGCSYHSYFIRPVSND